MRRLTATYLLGALALVPVATACGSDAHSASRSSSPSPSASLRPHEHTSVVEFREVVLYPGGGCSQTTYAGHDWCAEAGYSEATRRGYQKFVCPTGSATDGAVPSPPAARPGEPLLACSADAERYLLASAAVVPKLVAAKVETDVGGRPVVEISVGATDQQGVADLTGEIAGTGRLFAIVVDGAVLTAATAASRITGAAQINGDFTKSEAVRIAARINQ